MSQVNHQSVVEARAFVHNNIELIPRSVKYCYGLNRTPVPLRIDFLHNFPIGTLHHSIAWAYKQCVLQQSGVKNGTLHHSIAWAYKQCVLQQSGAKKHLRGVVLPPTARNGYDTDVPSYQMHVRSTLAHKNKE
jgi:hypothetical protein